MEIVFEDGATKLTQIVDAFIREINGGVYKLGDFLPSVNQLSAVNNVSRQTVANAYAELKRRGLVGSIPGKGYFVNGGVNKVLMLLDSYTPFKDVLYNAVAANLPKGYTIDLLFHHYNLRIFESVINDSIGRYNMYVVMNFNNDRISDTLRKIDPAKLLILDWGKYKAENYSYVCQDFDRALYDCLVSGLPHIKKYRKIVMYLPDSSFHPRSCTRYFSRFCKQYGIQGEVVNRICKADVRRGTVYLVVPQKELIELVKFCRDKKYRLGSDVGLIAYNDTPMYEVIDHGITAISTDFALMGKRAAHFIASKQKIQEIIPTQLILRGTL
ncbi:MAG: GntR family transcriptional regulator [Bacteroidales bacterium]|jgi:DNA-binding transcriptional regulator YhcF (GntR family)|nr:GntR family transcriptional regulator [Bacteroidales bacterium]